MEEQEIRSAGQRFAEAYNRGDAAAVADFYTQDAKIMPPNREMVSGKQAIEAFWKTTLEMGMRKLSIETAEVGYDGNLAYDRGIITVSTGPEAGQPVTVRSKYLVLLKRQADGPWKIAVDIWNTDNPAQ